jgi:hypothetical protein
VRHLRPGSARPHELGVECPDGDHASATSGPSRSKRCTSRKRWPPWSMMVEWAAEPMLSEHLKRQMLGKKQVSPALTRLAVGGSVNLTRTWLGPSGHSTYAVNGLLAAQKGALVFSACCGCPSGVACPRLLTGWAPAGRLSGNALPPLGRDEVARQFISLVDQTP